MNTDKTNIIGLQNHGNLQYLKLIKSKIKSTGIKRTFPCQYQNHFWRIPIIIPLNDNDVKT